MKHLSEVLESNQLGNLELLATQIVQGFITGLHRSPYHGFSVEFSEHRQYNQGEPTRHIDWRLFARTERYYVKQFEEDINMRCHLLIDTSSSMFFPFTNPTAKTKAGFSLFAAAALMHLLRKQRDAIGLTLFDNKTLYHSDSRVTVSHAQMLYGRLEKMLQTKENRLNNTTDLVGVLHRLSEKIHKRSFVIIFSDSFGADSQRLLEAFQHLKHNQHEAIFFHVTDHLHEEQFELGKKPVKLIDMETGEQMKVLPSQIKEQYQRIASEGVKKIKEKCIDLHIDYVKADISEGFYHILFALLAKRQNIH